jgi:hypothetical protein
MVVMGAVLLRMVVGDMGKHPELRDLKMVRYLELGGSRRMVLRRVLWRYLSQGRFLMMKCA